MEHKVYEKIGEEVYSHKASNGLEIIIIPKKNYKKVYAGIQVGFGSKYRHFITDKEYFIPQGVAHFLEHKLFTNEDGSDITEEFVKIGLDCNAYTDFKSTVYYFSGLNRDEEISSGINLLLDFTQKPYFDEKGIEREKEIIIQELLMYNDSPQNQLHFGLLKNLYNNYAVRDDAVGTIEEIKSINKDLLYMCYNIFYHPNNMKLLIVGDVDCEKIISLVEENQKNKVFPTYNKTQLIIDEDNIVTKTNEANMDVSIPKFGLGIKPYFLINLDSLEKNSEKQEFIYKFYLSLVLGTHSKFYQNLINDKLINGSFRSSSYFDENSGYYLFYTDTDKPKELEKRLIKRLTRKTNDNKKSLLSEKYFLLYKKKAFGSNFVSTNSISGLFYNYLDFLSENKDFFKIFDVIESITFSDIEKVRIDRNIISSFIIYPIKKQA